MKRSEKREAKRSARSEARAAKAAKLRSEVRTGPGDATVRTVFAMVIANAATQFAIQAWMSYRFAKDVWAIPRPLCVAIIVALDLFAVTFMVFTYLMRNAKRTSQAYVWVIFAAGVGAQLFAAELYGSHEAWTQPVRIFAALPALFLASSLHGLILWRNHAGSIIPTSPPAPPAVTPPPARPVYQYAKPIGPHLAPRPGVRSEKRRTAAVQAAGKPDTLRDEYARRVVEQGERPADIAAEAGKSKRAVEFWVADYRKRHAAPSNGRSAANVSTSTEPQVNGHEFHADGPVEVVVN